MSDLPIVDAETGELLPVQAVTLFGTDEPREVVLRAKAHADALADVIKERGLCTTIQGKAYVHVEAWALLGSQLGVFAVCEDVQPVELEGVFGFKATVKAVTRHGEIVGRAVAYCMRDEPTWSDNPISKSGRKLERRTAHALAGMAETRATSRALRKPLGFIVQLAGYQATGAEEMPVGEAGGGESRPSQHGVGDPGDAPASPTDVPPALQTDEPRLTKAQATKLNVLVGRLRDAGVVTTEQLWLEAGYPTPIPDPDTGQPRFGGEHGLRDRLSKRTAHRLIDWLEDLEKQAAEGPQGSLVNTLPDEVRKRMEMGE